ncbi:hypothetical protein [Lonepinella sp. MS14435]|uniref:hypothetical protein n=1 Tax=unclassified Lonepinella TaxID=2642006 RepID=UPI0036DE39DB
MKTTLKLSALMSSVLGLTGCMLSAWMSDKIDESKATQQWQVLADKDDIVLAIAKAKQPIKGYEQAMILVGQKQSYLIQDTDSKRDILNKIFTQRLDFTNLIVRPHLDHHEKREYFPIKLGNHNGCNTESCLAVDLSFFKERDINSNQEEQKLEKIGFECNSAWPTYLDCRLDNIQFSIQTASAIPTSKLEYQFKNPMRIKFLNYTPNGGDVSRSIMKALIPVTLAIDIVTFPIQINTIEIHK